MFNFFCLFVLNLWWLTYCITTCLLGINNLAVTSSSFRDPVHAGGGSGPGRPEHRPRWAALQSDGANPQDPLQSDVLHQLHHRRGFSHWRRSVQPSALAFSWCFSSSICFNSFSSQQTHFTLSENQLSRLSVIHILFL